jgi:hypothetical protein
MIGPVTPCRPFAFPNRFSPYPVHAQADQATGVGAVTLYQFEAAPRSGEEQDWVRTGW